MIRLKRTRTKKGIPASLRGPARVKLNQELLDAEASGGMADGTYKFRAKVWSAGKSLLKAESGGKCAYCEAPVEAVAHGDVEHFRPKSVYWWLAYCYDNYAYSCQICNQTYKGNKFPAQGTRMAAPASAVAEKLTPDPLSDGEGMAWQEFEAACAGESADLPDVYQEDPEALFRWEADRVLGRVRIAARDGSDRCKRAAAAAESVLGLNREALMGMRWAVYEQMELLHEVLAELPAGNAKAAKIMDLFKKMVATQGEFAGMARYFLREEWGLEI